uniref:Uncharacterized protein n=1 Tax=Nonomuraea gerenzanensis TaxID=93944 RepID=A0A1M4DZZ5_9ACTN|nr:hypothetical protein BN4615_P1651 [Nonomuraea gerenzanensis]
MAFLVVWSTVHQYRVPVEAGYVDLPYHLALVGEVKHHFPPTLPSVLGEPLSYHWFVYAEMAATSWVTGIEPVTLVYRLSMLPMAAAMVVLVAVLGRRVGGGWGAGVGAVGVTYFLFSPALVEGVVFSSRSMFTVSTSPTQTFGALLFVPVVLLLVGEGRSGRAALGGGWSWRGALSRGWFRRAAVGDGWSRRAAVGEGRWAGWVVLGVLSVVISGAKATYLPLLLAGVVVVIVVRWVVEWRVPGAWVGVAGLVVGCLGFAQVVLFGQGAQGMTLSPFATMRVVWGAVAGVGMPELASVSAVPLVVLTGVHLFCLACVWGGVVGLGGRVLEPGVSLLLGIGAAGVGATVVFGHPAESQLYFLEAARPYLSVAAVCGVLTAARVRLVREVTAGGGGTGGGGRWWARLRGRAERGGRRELRSRLGWWAMRGGGWRLWGRLGVVAVAGAGGALAVAGAGEASAVTGAGGASAVTGVAGVAGGGGGALVRVVVPYLVLGVAALFVGRRGGVVAVVAVLAGYAVPGSVRDVVAHVLPQEERRERLIPKGALEAGRWLRDHSSPDDVVATDLHCRYDWWQVCDSRHFWVSGFSERRVLVEGWAYAESTLSRARLFERSYLAVPFADRARLAANDGVFRAPTADSVRALAREYGVEWLFTRINPELGKYAELRFQKGGIAVYRAPVR